MTPTHPHIVYKILGAQDWRDAVSRGHFEGSADDHRDGFIHLSAPDQLAGTAAKYFKGRADLVLVGFEAAQFGAALRWEPSRGGALFPHLYGPLDASAATSVTALALDAAGIPIIPPEHSTC